MSLVIFSLAPCSDTSGFPETCWDFLSQPWAFFLAVSAVVSWHSWFLCPGSGHSCSAPEAEVPELSVPGAWSRGDIAVLPGVSGVERVLFEVGKMGMSPHQTGVWAGGVLCHSCCFFLPLQGDVADFLALLLSS